MHKTLQKSAAQIEIKLRIEVMCKSMEEIVVIGSHLSCTKYYNSGTGETEKLRSFID